MLLAIHNLYPSLRPYTTPFFQLSHYSPSQGAYVQGPDDVHFVFSSMIAFTAIRAIAIDWIFRPIARYAGLKKKASIRFAEQAWLAVYYGVFWSLGMVGIAHAALVLPLTLQSSISGRIPSTGRTLVRSLPSGLQEPCPVP